MFIFRSWRMLGVLGLTAWLAVPVTHWASRRVVPQWSVVVGTPGECGVSLRQADGLLTVFDNAQKRMSFWDTATGTKCSEIHNKRFFDNDLSTVLTPQGRILLAESKLGKIRIWDPATGLDRARITASFTDGLAFSPDGSKLKLTCGNRVQFWDIDTGRQTGELSIPKLQDSDITPGGRWLGTRLGMTRSEFRVWSQRNLGQSNYPMQMRDITTGRVQGELWTPCVFSPDGSYVAGLDNPDSLTLCVWDIAEWRPIATYMSSQKPLALSPRGEYLAAVLPARRPALPAWLPGPIAAWILNWPDYRERIGLLNRSGACVATLPNREYARFVNDQALVTVDGDCILSLWDVPPRGLLPRVTPWLVLSAALLLSAATWRAWRLAGRANGDGVSPCRSLGS